jgi:hypothetical protein
MLLYFVSYVLSRIFCSAKCYCAECRCAECRYANCHYDECCEIVAKIRTAAVIMKTTTTATTTETDMLK